MIVGKEFNGNGYTYKSFKDLKDIYPWIIFQDFKVNPRGIKREIIFEQRGVKNEKGYFNY